jgi:hypothetical protein
MKKIACISFITSLTLLISACSEPGRRVTASTSDGRFALLLEAERSWIRPGDGLPIRVQVESLAGPVQEDVVDEVEFVVNNGTVSPSFMEVFLAGPDSQGNGAESRFTGWIVFTSSIYAGVGTQGEVHALFQDISATLKIRFAPAPEEL